MAVSSDDATVRDGAVVWLQPALYPWWPHKVEKVNDTVRFVAFGDGTSCVGKRKVREYNCDEVESMISKGRRKLKRKKEDFKLFCRALEEAEQYIQDHIDQSFTFLRTPAGMEQEGEGPKSSLSAFLDSSVCTLGSDTPSTPGGPWDSPTSDLRPHKAPDSASTPGRTPTSDLDSSFSVGRPRRHKVSDSPRTPPGGPRGPPQDSSPVGRPRRKVSSVGRKRRSRGENGCKKEEMTTPSKKVKVNGKGKSQSREATPTEDPLLAKSAPHSESLTARPAWKATGYTNCKVVVDPLTSRMPSVGVAGGIAAWAPGGAQGADNSCQEGGNERKRPRLSSGEIGVQSPDPDAQASPSSLPRPPGDQATPTHTPKDQDVRNPKASSSTSPSQQTTSTHIPVPSIHDAVGEASPTSPPPSDPLPPPVLSTSRLSPFSSDSDKSLELDSMSSDDEDLPAIDMKGEETTKIHQLKELDVVWVKYHKWPFWPALISSVHVPKKKKSKSTAKIYFFAYTDDLMSVNSNRKIAPFKLQNDLIEAGSSIPGFDLAVEEAKDFVRDRAEGKFNGCTPKQIIQEVGSQRPKSFSVTNMFCKSQKMEEKDEGKWSPLGVLKDEEEEEKEEEGEERFWDRSVSSSDGESEPVEEEEEEEDDSACAPYTYDRVVKEIESLRPELEGVVKGRVESTFHTIFTSGSKKEREKLKLVSRGPIQRWPAMKMSQLLDKVLLDIANVDNRGFKYALDVLLPEAIVRVTARIEGISVEQALADFL